MRRRKSHEAESAAADEAPIEPNDLDTARSEAASELEGRDEAAEDSREG
jgi:hypothetical protein